MVRIGNDWDEILQDEFQKEYYLKLMTFLKEEYETKTVYPKMDDIFSALRYTSYQNVKVVILGQDPYHGPNQAHGLAFSVQRGIKCPPSLVNIFKELKADLNIDPPSHGNLEEWAKQGVLLLNTALTVRGGDANSHSKIGWEVLTDSVITVLSERKEPMVFLLWGGNAKTKQRFILNPNHLVLTSVHPSPLSAYGGFFGCKHFSLANDFLRQYHKEVNWQLTD